LERMLLALYLLLALSALLTYVLYRNLNYWKLRNVPQEPPHPFYGNLVGFRKNRIIHDLMLDYYNKYRKSGLPFVGFHFLQKPAAFVIDTKLAKHILIKDFKNFTDRNMFHNERDDPLTGHLFNLDGKRWKEMRHKLSPTFSSGKMKFMFPTVIKVSEEFMNVMFELVPAQAGSSIIEIKDLMARFTTDVIGTCAFGIECNTLRTPVTDFRTMATKAFTEVRNGPLLTAFHFSFPQLAKKLRVRKTPEDVHQFFMNLVKQTLAYREREQIKRNDFMDMLIELKKTGSFTLDSGEVVHGLTVGELAAQVFVFFLAGFETSSSTMTYALYELAKNQDIQDTMRAEIENVLQQHENKYSYESIKAMSYVDQVISETLRLYTIVPHLSRNALNDYVVPGHPKLVIERGTQVILPACAYHRDEDLYPNPEKFDPERFSPEMVAARDSVEWLPFGDGPRNCIGMRFGQMQTRIGLTQLIRNFKFTVCDKTEQKLTYDPKSIVLSVNGIYLRVERV
ncbi:Cyp6a8, partial [Drosophila busckii]